MEYIRPVATQVFVMFILMLIGYLCAKAKWITDEGRKQFSNVVMKLVIPALIFMAYQKEFSYELVTGLLWTFVLSFISYVITIPMTLVLVRKNEKREFAIERFSLIFTNCAFMGVPLIEALFGSDGVLYVTAYITLFNLLTWTYGVMMIKNEVSFKSLIGSFKSPAIIAIFLGLICYFTQLKVPVIIAKPLKFIADMNTPLAMITAGATMAGTNLLKALKNPRILLLCFYRLLLLPIVCGFVFKMFGAPEAAYTTSVVAAACPTAAILVMLTVTHNKNDIYAAELVSVTTLFSLISLPLVLFIVNLF